MNLKKKLGAFFTLTRKSSGGFTLVELIVVIAILAILAGVAIPAYGGYVKKANKAADEQLLAALNKAFVSACLTNGESNYDRTDVSAAIDADGNARITVSNIPGFAETFAGLYEGGQFKVFTGLIYDRQTGMFKEATAGKYADLSGKFNDEDITKFNNSIFASLGVSSLMGQVDMATQVALEADPNSTLGQMVYNDENWDSLARYLGFDRSIAEEEAEFDLVFEELAMEKLNQMVAAGADVSTDIAFDAVYEQATQEILANAAVLVAATETQFDTDSFMQQLAVGNGKTTIQDSMDGATGNQEALAQTAMAYAMYMSYVSRNGGTASNDITEVLNTLETPEFQNYIADAANSGAAADKDGYLSAMNMIEDASGDKNAVAQLLVNGFNDPELVALLTQEVGG